MAPAAAASSGSDGGGLLVAAAYGGRQGSSGGGASGGGGVAGPNFFIYCSFILPCVGSFAVCHEHFTDTCMPCVAHGKAFAVCNMGFAVRHTANYSIPVVW